MTETRPSPALARYAFLDSLRGIAILGVVLTHVGLSVPGLPPAVAAFATFGFRGVQLFFMVSALTLCLVSKPGRSITGRSTPGASFVSRRCSISQACSIS